MRPLDLDSVATRVRWQLGKPRFNTRSRSQYNWFKRACKRAAKKHFYSHWNRIDKENPW